MTHTSLSRNRKTTKRRHDRKPGGLRRFLLLVATCGLIFLLLPTRAFQQQGKPDAQSGGERGTRSATTRPKRTTERRTNSPAKSASSKQSAGVADASVPFNMLAAPLATADFNLIGLGVTVGPATQTVPKNTQTIIQTNVQVPTGTDPRTIIAGLNPNYRVRGELAGPSFTAPLTLEAAIGQPLAIPALPNAGDHVVQNLRVVDIGAEGQPVVTSVTPDSCGIAVIDSVLISEVHVRELNYEQIINSGININDDSYQYFNFTLGVLTSSNIQNIQIPVAFPPANTPGVPPIIGAPTAPVGTEVPDIFPVMLRAEAGEGQQEPPELEGQGGGISIPGVIVFPGRVGFLQQHFEALVIVANGTPQGSGLVLKQLHAKVILPAAQDGIPPLDVAETQVGGRIDELEIHGLGADGRYGTADDLNAFAPGASGQASFLLRGLKQGLHTVGFELQGTLEGLPTGPLNVKGRISGAVLVRDASIAISFTHPSVVQKDQEYDLSMTLYNQGGRDLQGALAQLSQGSITGASLLSGDNGQRSFPTTIKGGDSATISWRLRAGLTGAVTASYVTINNGATATFGLVTGVAANGVPLSPDSLVLPEPVKYLPPSVVEAARAVLGLAWSTATAPPGSLPPGVQPISKQTVRDRAVELGIAGLRIRFGESTETSLETLARDWLGAASGSPDAGFADLLRDTSSGNRWYDSLGAYLYQRVLSGGLQLPALHGGLAAAETARTPFISALISQPDGENILGASLVDGTGKRVGLRGASDERAGELETGAILRLNHEPENSASRTLGQLLLVSSPAAGSWTLDLTGWRNGTADISLLLPVNAVTYRQVVFNGLNVTQGGRYRVVFRPSTSAALVLQEFSDGAFHDAPVAALETTVAQPQPSVVGVLQVSPDILDGGDKYGRVVGVLFSRPMSRDSIETANHYQVGEGTLADQSSVDPVGGLIRVTAAKSNFGDRFAFLSLDSPVGPYIKRDLIASSLSDQRGQRISQDRKTIVATVSPRGLPAGAYLTGRVISADNSPIPGATVIYSTQPCDTGYGVPSPLPLAAQRTDQDGRYIFDYVHDGDCGAIIISATHPVTHSTKILQSSVLYDGQHMILDPVFLARGRIQGAITLTGNVAPRAFARIVPDLDIIGSQLVQADNLGHYEGQNLPVGNVSVLAVGYGNQSNATGLAVGTVPNGGGTAVVNVSLNDISGVVSGRVIFQDGASTPSVGTLVVAYASFAEVDGNTGAERSVGYSYTDRDGSFTIKNLPIGNISLAAKDAAGHYAGQSVLLTQNVREVTGVLLQYPSATDTYGAISGTVLSEDGTPLAGAEVRVDRQAVRTDQTGAFHFTRVMRGDQQLVATDPNTQMMGMANVTVRPNQTVGGVNITIARPATISGHVYAQHGVDAPEALADAIVKFNNVQTITDAQGAYTLRNVIGNTAGTLVFIHPNKKLGINQPLVLASGETVTRNATFRPSTVHGKVLKPDGVTGTVAQLIISTLVPDDYGFLQQRQFFTQSLADGTFNLDDLNPGAYRVTAYNTEFATPVSRGGSLGANETQTCEVRLLATPPGKIQGRVSQPDGTPLSAGATVTLGNFAFPEIRTQTDQYGHYEFAESIPEGIYELTATDTSTGRTRRLTVALRANESATFNITLYGTGNLRVHVVDASGNPVTSGSVRVSGLLFPFEQRDADIGAANGGVLEFSGLPEGIYGASATRQGLGGAQQVTIARDATAEVTVQLQATGSIRGRVLKPGGSEGAGLADVSLLIGDRIIGIVPSSDAQGSEGAFSFSNIPTSSFTLEAFDNRTGRRGRATGYITRQSEVVEVNIQLQAIGAVTGLVTANGVPIAHTLVSIISYNNIQGTSAQATTDDNGRYRFTGIPVGQFVVDVLNAPGGLTGQTRGEVTGTVEPLADTIADVALQPSVTLTGTVQKADASGPVAGAAVEVVSRFGYAARTTTTDESGHYRLEFVPIEENMRIRAVSPTESNDRGEVTLDTTPEPGALLTVDVPLAGLGAVNGLATDHLGNPLSAGTVTLINEAWGTNSRLTIVAPVQADGQYSIENAPAGEFNLQLTVPDNSRKGAATGTIIAGQTVNLPINLEESGTVTGRLQSELATMVAGADVTLTIKRPTDPYWFPGVQRFTHSNAEGSFTFTNVPLGTLNLSVFDPSTDGTASISNRYLTTNGETFDYGIVPVDTLPPQVVSITPADGATGVGLLDYVTVRFSEPVRVSTANEATIRITGGAVALTPRAFNSGDGREVIIRRDPYTYRPVWFTDLTTYTVAVSTQVKDLAGHPLPSEVRASFTTADQSPPVLTSSVPVNDAIQVAIDTPVTFTFNKPLAEDQDFTQAISFFEANTSNPVEYTASLSPDRKTLRLALAAPLAESTMYRVYLQGVRDYVGNYGYFYLGFVTVDSIAPTVDEWRAWGTPLDGLHTVRRQPYMAVSFTDEQSGVNPYVDPNAIALTFDGVAISSGYSAGTGALSYTPPTALPVGTHTINARVRDRAGNATEKSATFVIEDTVAISSITPTSGLETGGFTMVINGTGLENRNQSLPQVFIGGNLAGPDENYYGGNTCDFGRCIKVKVPPGVPGTVTVEVRTDHGTATLPNGFTYEAERRSPFVVEQDTVLLWHLDEMLYGNECFYAPDATANHFDVDCYDLFFNSLVDGRFGKGAFSSTFHAGRYGADTDTRGLLSFGDSGFTLEGWYKVSPEDLIPEQTYTLMGRESTNSYGAQGADYALKLLPTGALQAQLFNANGDLWETTFDTSVTPFVDGTWHYVALSVERGAAPEQNRLVIYIDGAERASTPAPAGFGAVRTSPDFRFGTAFAGISDEIRVSSTAHTAEQIQLYYENETLRVGSATPKNLDRGTTTEVVVTGYKLTNAQPTLTALDGSPLAATIQITARTANSLKLSVNVDATAPVGDALLTLTENGLSQSRPVTIIAPQPFLAEAGTVLLWHMDETSGQTIADAGPFGINGTNYYATINGRFGKGRTGDSSANSNAPSLSFGAGSFTVESWFKAQGFYYEQPVVTKGYFDNYGDYDYGGAFMLSVHPTGGVKAQLRDVNGRLWLAQSATNNPGVLDDRWHLLAMVVARGAQPGENRLTIYVDGIERASVVAPNSFGAMRTISSALTVGTYYISVDEVRLLNVALPAASIRESWFGPGLTGQLPRRKGVQTLADNSRPQPENPQARLAPFKQQAVPPPKPEVRLPANSRPGAESMKPGN
jgi:hypothetical protein